MLGDGDWVEGEPKWWWKYVFPAKAQFWQVLAGMKAEPHPEPMLDAVATEISCLSKRRGCGGKRCGPRRYPLFRQRCA